MAQLTFTTSVQVTSLDGLSTSFPAGSHVVSCQDYAEFSRDISGSVSTIHQGSWSAVLVANVGDIDAICQVGVSPDFATFVIPSGGVILLPSTFTNLAGDETLGNALTVYTAGGDSRIIVAIAINNA